MLKKQLFIISLLFGVISSAMAADPVKLYGQLQVNGNQLCSEQESLSYYVALVMVGTICGLDFIIKSR